MKSVQVSQTSSEFASMDVKTSSRCSTFISSEVIHRVSSKLGFVGSTSPDSRLK
jgi:hypothetical protein